jgi:hypothetical protein
MDPKENLFDTFRTGEVDATDLSQIALFHFHSAGDVSPAEVVFGGGADHENYALKFVYKKQRLAKILAGPSLTPQDITAIRSKVDLEIRQPVAVKIATQVLFTHPPVRSCFRYGDIFQNSPHPGRVSARQRALWWKSLPCPVQVSSEFGSVALLVSA